MLCFILLLVLCRRFSAFHLNIIYFESFAQHIKGVEIVDSIEFHRFNSIEKPFIS